MQTDKFIFFWKPNEPDGFLSNWYPSPFTVDDQSFTCAEQFLMYKKALLFNDQEIASQILSTSNPAEIKALGRKVCNFSEDIWRLNREGILYETLYHKFSQNQLLLDQLLHTRNKVLAEASPYDTIYGIGKSFQQLKSSGFYDRRNWNGLNLLGEYLMRVRTEFTGLEWR